MSRHKESNGLRSFSQLIRPWSGQLTVVVILVGFLALADMVLPWALSLLVDDVFPALADQNGGWQLLAVILVSLCIIYVLRNVLFFISRMISVRVSEHVCFDLRQRLFDHMQQLGMDFYKSNLPGKISSRVMDDTFKIQTFIQDKLPTLLRYTIEFQVLLILLYIVNWRLALASTIVLPFHLWTYKKFYLPIRDSHNRAQEHLAEAHGSLVETFMGAQVIKGFSAEKRESESFLETIRAGREDQIKTKRFQFTQKVIADLFVGAGTVLLLGYGASEVYAGSMTIGLFLMFFWYVRMLYPSVLEIISGTGHFSQTSACVSRVLEMLDEPVDEIAYDMRTKTQTIQLVGPIELRNVHFAFDENTKVLNNINLCIDAGEHIAITGPSGGGKSTLVSLLPRFNDPSTGIISIGGHNIRDMRLQDVRGMFGVAFQDAFLFNSTILDNLRYAKPNATAQEIIEACKLTGAHEIIDGLPKGYDTRIGDQGVELSHGQKQRINLARALVRKPQTLIIDEITASIEASASKQIIKAVFDHMTGRTVIIVTHDPEILQLVHRVITLEDKTITQSKSRKPISMKHPTTKLGAIFFALCCIFFGCSTTTTKNAIIMEDPKSTGVIFEEEEPVDLVALADAFEVMMAKEKMPITHSATEPLPAPRPPTPVEIAELVSDNQQATRTSILLDLPRLNETELNEVIQRLINAYDLDHGYIVGTDSLDALLPTMKKGVHSLTTLTKKNGESTKLIRLGHQTFLSQPNQLWVEGFEITNEGFMANADAEFASAYATELLSSLSAIRKNLSILDLEKKIIQLSYVDASSAITMLNGLGVTTYSNANEVPDEVDWDALPYVVQIPEPSGKDTGLVGGSAIQGGSFGLTMVPSSAGELSENTISSPMTQIMVFFDPARPETFSNVQTMITQLVDRAARQIFIEGMVLEINEDGIKDMGINWRMFDTNSDPAFFDLSAGKNNAGADGDTFNFTLLDLNLERAFTRFNEWWFDVDIRAMVRDGKAEILSRPSILTLNNRQATIRVGEDIPIATSTAGMSNADMLSFNFKYLPTGIMLNIRPRIAEDGKEVSMMIDTIVSSSVPGADLTITDANGTILASAPTIASRRVQTYGIIPNNTPFIIGGLVNKEQHTVEDKVPLLGDLPLIGGLFRANRTTSNKTEVIIVLTPHVLPTSGELLSAMPKDDPRFDAFGNELFRDSYRIKNDDVLDLKFIDDNEQLSVYREIAALAISKNFRLKVNPALSPFADGHFPGESILVTRMIYELIKRLNVADKIQPARLAFFKSETQGGMTVQFLDRALQRTANTLTIEGFFNDTRDLAMAVIFEDGKDIPTVTTLICPDRDAWREYVWELNQPTATGVGRQAFVIQNESDLLRLRRAVALKHFLDLNNGKEALELDNFKVGQYILVPDLDPTQVHIVDANVAKYFYQTEHYYHATLDAIREATNWLESYMLETDFQNK
ncbi:MAG: ATP-binding cassette domain-containing protein [Phycisphaerae bacterium]|nr:ATP-binding cassette domain-containing protein [Phycisphaerae bacterium]MBT6282526.1 ATP-binding cassette domain-containing protein [Phycisphaerae bacterium]